MLLGPPWHISGTPFLLWQLQMLVVQHCGDAITPVSVPPKNTPQLAIMIAIRIKRIYSPCVQELLDLAFYAAFIRKYIASFTAM
jgi:hypothetical protein